MKILQILEKTEYQATGRSVRWMKGELNSAVRTVATLQAGQRLGFSSSFSSLEWES